jgi:hypothetical protein
MAHAWLFTWSIYPRRTRDIRMTPPEARRSPTAPDPPMRHAPGTSYSKAAVLAALQATGRCPEPTCGRSKDQLKMIKNAMLRNVRA